MTIQIYNNCYGFLTSIYEFVFYHIIKITNVNSMIVIEVKYVAIILPSTLPFISPLTCLPSTLSCSHPTCPPQHHVQLPLCSSLPIHGVSLKYWTSAFLSLLLSYPPLWVIKSLFMVKVNFNCLKITNYCYLITILNIMVFFKLLL